MEKAPSFGGWVRIDDRLIHGQVTVGWHQYLRYREIWIVDDAVQQEPYLWDALRLAAPMGIEVRVLGLDEAVEVLTGDNPPEHASTMMLLRDPEGVLALVEGGVSFERVNVGNLGSRPGSVRAIKNVSLTQNHIEALDELAKQGVKVFFQLAPEDARFEWEAVRRRMNR